MRRDLEDDLGLMLQDILTRSQHFRLTIDLKKLKLANPLCHRVVDDQAFVDSVSLSYLTSPVFQSNDVFHAVSVRRNSRDPTELVVTDGYCSFRFEDRLTWLEFVNLFLPSDQNVPDPAAGAGAALPIYVRAQLENEKCSTVGIGTLSFASFLSRRLPSLNEMPSSYFAACTSMEKGVDIPVFEILMKLPLIRKETNTIAGILCVGVAIDVMNLDITQDAMRGDPRSPLVNVMSAPITNIDQAEYSTAHYGHDGDLSRCITSDNYSFVKQPPHIAGNAGENNRHSYHHSDLRFTANSRPDANQETRLHGREKRAKSQERARPRTHDQSRPRSRTRDRSQERDGLRDDPIPCGGKRVKTDNMAQETGATHDRTTAHDRVMNTQDELAISRISTDKRSGKIQNSQQGGPLLSKEQSDGLVREQRRPEPCQVSRGIADHFSEAPGDIAKPARGSLTNSVETDGVIGEQDSGIVGGTSPQESGIIQGNKDHLLQCEVMLLKLNAEQAHQKFREEMKQIESKSEERLEAIRKENQKLRTENKQLEKKLVEFERQLKALQEQFVKPSCGGEACIEELRRENERLQALLRAEREKNTTASNSTEPHAHSLHPVYHQPDRRSRPRVPRLPLRRRRSSPDTGSNTSSPLSSRSRQLLEYHLKR